MEIIGWIAVGFFGAIGSIWALIQIGSRADDVDHENRHAELEPAATVDASAR
jgi:hypothetical protein